MKLNPVAHSCFRFSFQCNTTACRAFDALVVNCELGERVHETCSMNLMECHVPWFRGSAVVLLSLSMVCITVPPCCVCALLCAKLTRARYFMPHVLCHMFHTHAVKMLKWRDAFERSLSMSTDAYVCQRSIKCAARPQGARRYLILYCDVGPYNSTVYPLSYPTPTPISGTHLFFHTSSILLCKYAFHMAMVGDGAGGGSSWLASWRRGCLSPLLP
jgi:hypothetical protein